MNLVIQRAALLLISVISLFVCGCSSPARSTNSVIPAAGPSSTSTTGSWSPSTGATRSVLHLSEFPWETWVQGRDFDGFEVSIPEILRGDELAARGDAAQALRSYEAARRKPMIQSERFALISRIVSMHLRLDKPAEALTTLTQFFEAEQISADEVPARLALLFGYAYGMRANTDQAIAWFSQAGRNSDGRSSVLTESGELGIRALLQNMGAAEFEEAAGVWRADSFVSGLIARERHLRAQREGVSDLSMTSGSRFWEHGSSDGPVMRDMTVSGQRIVAFLPLSGSYASLGAQVKAGLELAFLGRPESQIRLEVVDTHGETFEAVARLREVLATGKPDFIIGPLLSDVAVAVSEEARRHGVPVMAFSKRDFFPVGGGVFRLGATVDSQVLSLITTAINDLGAQRHVIIYPNNALGESFANSYRDALTALGGTLVMESAFNEGDSRSLVDLAKEIEKLQVDAIFLPASLETAGRFWTSVQPQLRSNMVLLGPANWYSPVALRNAKAALDGATFVSPFFLESERDIVKKFSESFKNYFQTPPDFLAAQGFDAATLVLSALERSHQTGVPVGEVLSRISGYNGLTGSMKVQQQGEIVRDFPVVEMRRGVLREVERRVATPSFSSRGDEVYRNLDSSELDALKSNSRMEQLPGDPL